MTESAQEKMAQAFQEQQAQWSAFTSKAWESSMKLFELNLKMARQSLAEASQSAKHLLAAKSPEEIFTVDQTVVQDRLNQLMAYANEISEITAAFTAELGQAAQEQMSHTAEKAAKLVADAKHPTKTQNFFPQFGELSHGYDQWLDAGKKFAEAFSYAAPGAPVHKAAPVKKPVTGARVNAKSTSSRARAR